MTQPARTLSCAAALALCCAAAFIGAGCRSKPVARPASVGIPHASIETKAAANEVREAANVIQNANAEIAAAVPEVAAQTTEIGAGVDRLRAVETSLRATQAVLESESKAVRSMAADLTAANARIVALEDKSNGILNNILIGVSILGLAAAVVAGVWLRSWQGVVTGLAVFAACTAGMWLLKYRAIIAICGLAAAAGYAAWCIIAERRATTQIVKTVEAIKANTPDFKTVANGIQTSKLTRRIVDRIKGTA
jgi:hypothetical protein